MTRRRRFGPLAFGTLLAAAGATGLAGAVRAQVPWIEERTPFPWMANSPAFQEYSETYRDWKLYCQLWSRPQRAECEVGTRRGSGPHKASRLVWLRSSERWMDGLRFRLDERSVDIAKGVRLWFGPNLVRPEFPCERSRFERSTCTVTDSAVNERLVQRMADSESMSAVGLSPAGEKVEVFFSLKGFREAVERMDELRLQAGVKAWM
ncbi:hypothetical protein [Azospirillum sp. A39]|uniref:hypothetical protein n=1 Tax=Azospirillum sp. A39 TaxID=3462279 RepID=UPI004045E572